MSSQCHELGLEDILADSIIEALMEADGVDSQELTRELRQTAALLHATWPRKSGIK